MTRRTLPPERSISLGDLLIEPVKIGVVAGFLGFHKAVVDRLPIGDKLRMFEQPMALLR